MIPETEVRYFEPERVFLRKKRGISWHFFSDQFSLPAGVETGKQS